MELKMVTDGEKKKKKKSALKIKRECLDREIHHVIFISKVTSGQKCPDGWSKWSNYCYYFVPDRQVTNVM